AVPLVEPLRLHALFARCRLSAFQAHAKHLHGIGKLLLLRIEFFVHGVPRGGGPKMRQSSSRQVKMRRIRMAYRRKQPPASVNRIQIDNLAKTLPLDQCLQPGSRAASFHRQRIDARRAVYDAGLAAIAGYHPNGVGIVEYLRNEHSVTSLVSRRSPCTNSGSDGTTPPSAPFAFPRPLSRRGVKIVEDRQASRQSCSTASPLAVDGQVRGYDVRLPIGWRPRASTRWTARPGCNPGAPQGSRRPWQPRPYPSTRSRSGAGLRCAGRSCDSPRP